MPRIRTIKPDFFKSKTINSLKNDTTRLFFIGLLTYVDDEGKGLDDSELLAAELYPRRRDIDLDDINALMTELEDWGLIERYIVANKLYFRIRGWKEHQKVNRPSESKYPDPILPGQTAFSEPSVSPPGILTEVSVQEKEREVERERELGKGTVALLRKNERPLDQVWEMLAHVCRVDVSALTRSERSGYAKVVHELVEVGATGEDIVERAAAYRLAYPDAALTPRALAKHWSSVVGVATQPKVDKRELEQRKWVEGS